MQVESILRRCSVEELRLIALEIRVPQADVTDKTKIEVMRKISEVLDGLADDDQKMTTMKRMIPAAPDSIMPKLCSALTKTPGKTGNNDDAAKVIRALTTDTGSTLRRELKFTGTIDGGTDTDMDYVGVTTNVEDARKKGYGDEEIAMAVRRCVAPGSDTRSYFDLNKKMTLDDMLTFISSSQKETTSRQLYKTLSNAFQKPEEESQKYAVRLLGLREKLRNASESEDWVRYNAEQIQEVFLEALRTGLREDAVKTRIEAFIIPGTIASAKSDSDIVSKLKAIDAEEAIRKDKMEQSRGAVSRLPVKVNEVNLPNNTQNAPMSSFEVAMMDKLNEMSDNMNTVKDLSATVQKLEKEMSELKTQKPNIVQKFNKKKYGCDHCVQNNKTSCGHCFVCGAGDHKSFDPNCPKRKGN